MNHTIHLDVTTASGRNGIRKLVIAEDDVVQAVSNALGYAIDSGDTVHDFTVVGEAFEDEVHEPFPEDDRGTTPFGPDPDVRFKRRAGE